MIRELLALPVLEKVLFVLVVIGIVRVWDGVFWLLARIPTRLGTIDGNTPVIGVAFHPRFTLLLWRSSVQFGASSNVTSSTPASSIMKATSGEET